MSEPSSTLSLAQVKARGNPAVILSQNRGATLVDLGDGVACLEFHTKLNTIDDDVIGMLGDCIARAAGRYRALVIGNDAADFSAGANLGVLLEASRSGLWHNLDRLIKAFQDALTQLKYSSIPVVIAPSGRALGGGCEVILHGAHVRAHAELRCGLVEVRAGLIPAGGGCKEMLLRHGAGMDAEDSLTAVQSAFDAITGARVSTSAEDARGMRLLRQTDTITPDRQHLLSDAKADAVALAGAARTPLSPALLRLPGESGRLVLEQQIERLQASGTMSAYDAVIAQTLASVLTGGQVSPNDTLSEQAVLDLEREAFLSLCGMPMTQARMQSLLQTGKPLRN